MGVQRLNQFIRDNCGRHAAAVPLSSLAGQRIAVDASIYMYKFLGDRSLLAGIYQMVVLFRNAGAELVFVFDGAPPPEKREAQEERKRRKWQAHDAYVALEQKMAAPDAVPTREMHSELANLRRRSLRLSRRDVDSVRSLLSYCGTGYINAPQEADHICARLVLAGTCWACLSEDTDMFALGCPRVLKGLCLPRNRCILYNWEEMRDSLPIQQDEFRLVCAAAGTDYGSGIPHLDLEGAWERWREWRGQPQGTSLLEHMDPSEQFRSVLTVSAQALMPSEVVPPIILGARNMKRVERYLGRFGIVFSGPI